MNPSHGHGAIKINPIHRFLHRKFKRTNLGKATIPFNWNVGYDVRDTIGAITIKDQGQSDSCGGQAGSYFLEIQRRLNKINEGSLSAKSVYAQIFYPGGGTTIPALETQLAARGAELESSVPSYTPQGVPLTEQDYEDKSWLNQTVITDMETRAGFTPLDVPLDINSVASYTQQYGTCIWEIEGQDNLTWDSSHPLPPITTNPNEIWRHFMCIIGAKLINNVPSLIVLNSWGTSIGDGGVQYFTQDYFNAGGIVDVFTLVPDAQIKPIQSSNSIWDFLWYYFMKKPLSPVSP